MLLRLSKCILHLLFSRTTELRGFLVYFFFLPMFTDCEMGSSGTGRGINESGSYWISKSELLAAYIIFSYVPLPSGDLQKFTCFFRFFW